jgi:hypothetical protein
MSDFDRRSLLGGANFLALSQLSGTSFAATPPGQNPLLPFQSNGQSGVQTQLITPFDYGAVGDGVANDTAALQAMATAANALVTKASDPFYIENPPQIYFPPCAGFRTTLPIKLVGSVHLNMVSPIIVSADASASGRWLEMTNPWGKDPRTRAPRRVRWRINIKRQTQSNWTSEEDIGFYWDAAYEGDVHLERIEGFAVGFDGCLAYGRIILGSIWGAKKGGKTSARVNQFSNQMQIIGGEFACGGYNPGMSRYGLELIGKAPSGLNSISLFGQSYELGFSDARRGNPLGEAVPLLLSGVEAVIGYVSAHMQRMEGCGPYFARATGKVYETAIGILHSEAEAGLATYPLLDNQATHCSALQIFKETGANGSDWQMIWDSGSLSENAVGFSDQGLAVRGMEAVLDNGASPPVWRSYTNDGNSKFNPDGMMSGFTTDQMLGVRIALNGERTIALEVDKAANSGLTITILCFDASGTQIMSANAVTQTYAGYGIAKPKRFGGAYDIGGLIANPSTGWSATAFRESIGFAPNVATIFVGITSKIRRFAIRAPHGRARRIKGVLPSLDRIYAPSIPVKTANIAYVTGMTVDNISPAKGQPKGWVCTNGVMSAFLSTGSL